jgi:hypothetical protein
MSTTTARRQAPQAPPQSLAPPPAAPPPPTREATQTEFPFVLPRGYLDAEGTTHREGRMRLANAYDEIVPMKDPRVQVNPGYLVIILLSRVITRLGDLPHINPKVIEGLFSADLAYLQDLYRRINDTGAGRVSVTCPHCERDFLVELDGLGG